MSNVRRYNETRTLFDYNALVNGVGQDTIICVDRNILPVIIELLATYGLYRTSYFTELRPQNYDIPDYDDFSIIRNMVGDAVAALQIGYDMGTCENIVLTLEAISVTLKEVRDSLNNQTKALALSDCGCVGQGTNPVPFDGSSACATPSDFDTFQGFLDYGCLASNWLFDRVVEFWAQVGQSDFWLYGDYNQFSSQYRLGINQVYQKFAQQQAGIFALEYLYNLADSSKVDVLTGLTDLYYQMATDKWLRVPEFDVTEDVLQDWYGSASDWTEYLLDNRATIVQDWFDATTAGDLVTAYQATVAAARAYVDSEGNGLLGVDILESILSAGFDVGAAMLAFSKSQTISLYTAITPCAGSKGCCPSMYLLEGAELGDGEFRGLLVGGAYELDILANATGLGVHCDDELEGFAPTILTGGISRYRIYDSVNDSVYDSPSPWTGETCSRRFRFSSSQAFTVSFSLGLCS